jgi:16S rRNA (cytosine1402-N4)-methyltransferase
MTMGMNKLSAHDVLQDAPQALLEDIFRIYGEEPQWKKLAQGIVEKRQHNSFRSTQDFATWISNYLRSWSRGIHRATLAFQALRIYVNEENEELQGFLKNLPEWFCMASGVALISFHSIEDRLIKLAFQGLESIQKGVNKTTQTESRLNPRSRSAKLRWGIKK